MDHESELEQALGALSLDHTTFAYSLLIPAAVDTECMNELVDASKLDSILATQGGLLTVYELPDGTTQARKFLRATDEPVPSHVRRIETVNDQAIAVGLSRSHSRSMLFLSAKLDDLETQLPDSVTPGATLGFRNLRPVNIVPDLSVQLRAMGLCSEPGASDLHAGGEFTTEVQRMQLPNGDSMYSERPARLGLVEGDLYIGDSRWKSVSAEVVVSWTTLPGRGESDEGSSEA